jgi:lysophospholipase L1-like esterase
MMPRLISLFIVVLLSACKAGAVDQQVLVVPDESLPEKPLRYLALGDSYTIGEAVSEEERWPNQLADGLRSQGFEVEDPLIVARSGWATGDLAQGIQQAEISPPYDLVSLLIGANNQFRGYSQETYHQEFASLLEQAVAFAGGRPERVLVLSIPDWGAAPFGSRFDRGEIASQIDAFNAINLREAERAGVQYIDVTSVSRCAAGDLRLVASDGLHPSGIMYAEWSTLALKAAMQALKK